MSSLASIAVLHQIISVVGAVLILAGYAALQRGLLDRDDRAFSVLNFVGSSLLAWIAIVDQRLGFIVLEVAWALLSVPGMVRRRSAMEKAGTGDGGPGTGRRA